MKSLNHLLFPSERVSFLYIFLCCLIALIFVYGAEHFFQVYPCSLCIGQRYFFWSALILALMGFFLNLRILLYILALVFMGCAFMAGYQVLVELKLVPLPGMCQTGSMANLDEFKKLLSHGIRAPCDQISWSLFGISMAGYNVPFCLLLGLYSGISGLYYKKLDVFKGR